MKNTILATTLISAFISQPLLAQDDPFTYLDFSFSAANASNLESNEYGSIKGSMSLHENIYMGAEYTSDWHGDDYNYGFTIGLKNQLYTTDGATHFSFAEYTWKDYQVHDADEQWDFSSHNYKLGVASDFGALATKLYVGYYDHDWQKYDENWVVGAEAYYKVTDTVSFGLTGESGTDLEGAKVGIGLRVSF